LRAALEEAREQLPQVAVMAEPLEVVVALHAAGRLTGRERAELMRAALVEIVEPCAEALLGPSLCAGRQELLA
jgi:hypothetical protein